MVRPDGPEERQTRCKSININTCGNTGTEIFQTVCQGVSQLNIRRSTRFLHVIAGDGNGVELRHLLGSIFKDVRDNLHGEGRRIDISITYHEFFQNIILDSTCHFFQLGTLFQTCIDIECHNRKHSTVHSHGHGHLVQRNSIEQHLHVLQGTNGYTRLADITHHAFVVGVITTVSGQVESYRQTFLAGSQITTIECIGFFGCGETGILTDGPGTQGVHHRIRTTQIRRKSGSIAQVFHSLKVFFCINRLHFNVFRRFPISMDAVSLLPLSTVDGLKSGIYI